MRPWLTCACLMLVCCAPANAADARRNVLFIISDESLRRMFPRADADRRNGNGKRASGRISGIL